MSNVVRFPDLMHLLRIKARQEAQGYSIHAGPIPLARPYDEVNLTDVRFMPALDLAHDRAD